MILLDTNVISEPWKPAPNETVVAWLDAQTIETLFLGNNGRLTSLRDRGYAVRKTSNYPSRSP